MVVREQYYALLRGEWGEDVEALAVSLAAEYPYCHSLVLLRALCANHTLGTAQRKVQLRYLAAQLPSGLPLYSVLERGYVLPMAEHLYERRLAGEQPSGGEPPAAEAGVVESKPLDPVMPDDGLPGTVLEGDETPGDALETSQEIGPSVVIDWDSLEGEEEEAVLASEELNLEGVLAASLATAVPGTSASIFPFVGLEDQLCDEDLEFVTTLLNPFYKAASEHTPTQREAIDAYLDNLDALVDKLRALSRDENYSTDDAEDLSRSSAILSPEIISERLAQAHVQRGEYSLAIAMYERLAAKNPEKSSYFAGIIDGLKDGESPAEGRQ